MYTIEKKTLTDIADAIREKTGKSDLILPGDMPGEINGIDRDGNRHTSKSDLSFLPQSNGQKILVSEVFSYIGVSHDSGFRFQNTSGIDIDTDELGFHMTDQEALIYQLDENVTDVTFYGVVRHESYYGYDHCLMGLPYENSSSNAPNFYTENNGTLVATRHGNNTSMGVSAMIFNVCTIAINAIAKKARFYVNGVFKTEMSFSNYGKIAVIGRLLPNISNYNGATGVRYVGIVSDLETDATIIANHQTIMTKLGMAGN